MRGTWRWVVVFAAFGAVLTFLFSLSNNPLATTALRSLYAFLAFGLVGAAVHVAVGQLLRPANAAPPERGDADGRGSVVDLSTPDDDGLLNDMLKEQREGRAPGTAEAAPAGEFQPLAPKKLVSVESPEPEAVVQAIRQMSDE
ncbi:MULTISPECIES: hypothetical protein [Cohnella]|uniref:hypothetical protein n=1 Tax=Cohnella TaxID=329857 RepID=UPI001119A5BA|nr:MULTISPECIES: hypothetical protein [Cohnella]MBN2983622.1 hypothetical protein [Cohnella algarum]